MTLIKRLKLILFPVIFSTFFFAGFVIYSQAIEYKKEDISRQWTSIIELFQFEHELEMTALQSSLDLLLNSPELINFLNRSDKDYAAYTLEVFVQNRLLELRQRTPNLESVQIIDDKGNFIVSADNTDPFEDPSWPSFPKETIELNSDPSQAHNLPELQLITYPSEHDELMIGLIRTFSPELNYFNQPTANNTSFKAVASGWTSAYRRFSNLLEQSFILGYQVTLNPVSSPQTLSLTNGLDEDSSNNIVLHKSGEYFDLTLIVEQQNITFLLKRTLTIIGLLFSLLGLATYLIILSAIRRQMVDPIQNLIADMRQQSNSGSLELTRLDKNDEVAQLNNSYVNLLEKVKFSSEYDGLTRLANRENFVDCIEKNLRHFGAQKSEQQLAVLYIDLDNFKKVNDHFGHNMGDQVLCRFAQLLCEAAKDNSSLTPLSGHSVQRYISRLSGDEFAVLLNDIEFPWQVEAFAVQINHFFSSGFQVAGRSLDVYASIGICFYPGVAQSAEDLMNFSDEAMYQAKKQGRNQFQVFTGETAKHLSKRKLIESELNLAHQNGDFKLVYQPIFNAIDLSINGYEVLLRCPSLLSKSIGPDLFIPIAESTGLIHDIDMWVIEQAFLQHKQLQTDLSFTGVACINISAAELTNSHFPKRLKDLIKRYDIDPSTIELEITETSLVDINQSAEQIFQHIKNTGVRIALDDFGTGYTGFNQLSRFPINTLKIDRSFVSQIKDTPKDTKSTFDVLIQLASIYQLHTIVEGVETQDELSYVRTHCDQLQGYFLSKPIDFDVFCSQLKETS